MSLAEKIYDSNIRNLPAAERLAIATLILQSIAPTSIVDESDEWNDEDLRDFSQASLATAEASDVEAR